MGCRTTEKINYEEFVLPVATDGWEGIWRDSVSILLRQSPFGTYGVLQTKQVINK